MSTVIEGKVIFVGDTQQVSDAFKKRNFVVETTEGQYPQKIQLELHQDKTELANSLRGKEVKASINIRGREWTNPQGEVKYFNTLVCWKIEDSSEQKQSNEVDSDSGDDLPF